MAFNQFRNMYDDALKPQLLHSLIEEYVPDEKHPFRSPEELKNIVSAIKTHRLIFESSVHVKDWKSAVDSWVDRLLVLICSNMPDKCWAGICLLGVTCQECSSDRFLTSYSVWFHKLLSHIQPPAGSHFVKAASCISLSDLFTRLAGFPSVKNEGTSLAGKLVQPALNLLNEDSSEAVMERAIDLLCTILISFPSSVHRHYDIFEAAIVSKIMSANCNENMMKKLARCLALLPTSKGDVDSWSLMMKRILLSINVLLNDSFQGLEGETKFNEAVKLLVPPGEDPPPPLGCQITSGETSESATRRDERLLMSNVSTLILCCCTMLTSYPIQVIVPVRQLLALVERVLAVDGSLSQASFHFMTATQQGVICSELPILHSHSLELLTAIIRGLRGQLLPHAAEIVRLLTEYFRKCKLPELRVKVYSIVRILLTSTGVGLAVFLIPDLTSNAFVDLDIIGHESGGTSSTACPNASPEALSCPSQKRMKHAATTGSFEKQHNKAGWEMEAPTNNLTPPTFVKIAALEALTALLTMGGAWRSESWRPKVDLLLITVAKNACYGGWVREEREGHTSTWADFQLASLRALRASLLSPSGVRPPYLSQGFELFRRGKQEMGTRLAEFCAQALFDLEVLIHPKARSLAEFFPEGLPSANYNLFGGTNCNFSENAYSGGQKHSIPFSSDTTIPDEDDDLYHCWLGNGDEVEVPVTDSGKKMSYAEQPSESSREALAGKLLSVDGSFIEENSKEPEIAASDTVMDGIVDEIMSESQQAATKAAERKQLVNIVSENGALNNELGSDKDVWWTKSDGFSTLGENNTKISNHEKSKVPGLDHDTSSPMDSFPDIVDADPDSDS